MLMRTRLTLALVLGVALASISQAASPLSDSLKKGNPDLKSVGTLAFGPEGILFVGDPQSAAIFAIGTGDTKNGESGPVKIDKLDEKIASMLGTTAKEILVNSLAVNPASGNVYLSVSRGKGPTAAGVLLKVDRKGKIAEVPLKDVPFAKVSLPNAADKQRQEAITQIRYVKGRIIVAGLSNEEFASTLRSIPFPFTEADKGAGIQIWHGAHGKFETRSPVRTFVPYDIKGETNILAAYTCTPLVKIPVSQLKAGTKVKGTTIAELGNRNRPLDMIVYQKGGKDFILMSNSSRGVMKIPAEGIDKIEPITKHVTGGSKAGLSYETLKDLKGVHQMDKLDKDNAVVLIRAEGGALSLNTIGLP